MVRVYFSFFVISCFILNGCLLATSPSVDEAEKNIVGTRQVSLVKSHPTADLRLNPGRGETVWSTAGQPDVAYSYTYFGKKYSVKLPVDFMEITFSPLVWYPDQLRLLQGLEENYRKRGVHDVPEIEFHASDKDITVNGFLTNGTLMFCIKDDFTTRYQGLLRKIQKQAAKEGRRSIHISSSRPSIPHRNIFVEEGFQITEEDWKTEFPSVMYYKTAHQFYTDNDIECDEIIHYKEEDEKKESSSRDFENHSGFFIRNERGAVLGGISAENLSNLTGLDDGSLWIEEPTRKRGLGKKLLSVAEDFVRDKGMLGLMIQTGSYEGYGFYERAGYTLVMRCENVIKMLNETWGGIYFYYKNLQS